jgi:hypothetical protein
MKTDRSPRDWYEEAVRCYRERHQGCPWCGGSYRVYHIHRPLQTVYYCHGCEFRVEFDRQSGEYQMVPGEATPPSISTMMDLDGALRMEAVEKGR